MKEIFVISNNSIEAYHKALVELNSIEEIIPCTDYNTNQKECSITIVVNEPLSEPRISKLSMASPESLEQYRQEMLDGILDFKIGDGWEYTYHDRIANYEIVHGVGVNQVKFVIDELKRNPESRRAVIDIRHNLHDMYSEDPACLQHIQYFIRNGKLDCKVLFRSNDATRACFMNMFALIELQKRIADKLEVEVGTYTHRANSFHCYEAEFEKLNSYSRDIKNKSLEELSYNYEGCWDEMMFDSESEIAVKVASLQ